MVLLLMGQLVDPVAPGTIKDEPVNVVLIEDIFSSGTKQIVQVPNGLNVGMEVPEERRCRRDWRIGRPLSWRWSGALGGSFHK